MFRIVLAGAAGDTSLTLPLCRALEKHGGVVYFGNSRACEYGLGIPRFLIYETENPESLQIENALVVFKSEQAGLERKISAVESAAGLAEAENPAIDRIRACFPNTLTTCGAGAKNTVTLSSLSEGSASISVQNTVKLLDGKELEPCEFRVKLSSRFEGIPLLFACAVLILTGNFEEYTFKI